MNYCLVFISIILLSYTPGQCQRRNHWRGPRQGTRRHTCMEERVRSMRTPQIAPNYNPVLNKALPVATASQNVEPPTVYEPPPVFQNMPKMAGIPNVECAQNVVLLPNMQLMQTPKIPDVPKMPAIPNVECTQNMVLLPKMQLMQTPQIEPNPQPIQTPVPNIPMIQAQYLPNLQHVQNVQLIPNVPLIPESPVPNLPSWEVPIPAAEKTRKHIPYPSVEPLDRYFDISPPAVANPYLPAASPVSARSPPMSNHKTSQYRSNFLRKIAIPPPTL